jgi:hypothetical protein
LNFKQFFILCENIDQLLELGSNLAKMPRSEIQIILGEIQIILGGKHSFENYLDREKFVSKFSWSIPCKEAIDAIREYGRQPIYDLMAGTGFWSKVLNEAGIKTIASDLHISKKFNPYKHSPKHFKVKRINAIKAAVDKTRRGLKGDVLLSWPPYECPVATDVLQNLPIGTRVFYIGESYGGCTADASFFSYLSQNCKKLKTIYLPQFSGLHDALEIYEKVKEEPIDDNLRGKTLLPYNDDD